MPGTGTRTRLVRDRRLSRPDGASAPNMDAAPALLLLLLLAGSSISTTVAAVVKRPLAFDANNLRITDENGNNILDLSGLQTSDRIRTTNRDLTVTDAYDRCLLVKWRMESDDSMMNCFPLGDANWFGGGEEIPQKWPLEKYDGLSHSMVTQETANRGVQDPFWFNSKGVSIFVPPGVPLFLHINADVAKSLCLEAKIEDPYRARKNGFHLSYYVCKSANAKEAFMHAVKNFLKKPTGYPDERMIRYPVWSTWARYKAAINEIIVREFAKEIRERGFKNSQLEIDDNWETCYGSKIFDTNKFSDINAFVKELKKDGFRVTLWTHPFVNLDCTDTLNEGISKGYFVSAMGTNDNVTSHWWNGVGAVVDFTKPDARNWFIKKHQDLLQASGIDGFKFDAGETSWFPQLPNFDTTIPEDADEDYPSMVVKSYVQTCATFGNISEVRSAYRTQEEPIFLRMIDKDSRWNDTNGLKSLVTTLLQMNMVGYSMVLPDMIGGNQYNGEVATRELFIRWLQANTFMPALQYALVPWDYDNPNETSQLCQKFNDLHDKYTDKIIAAMKKNVEDGSPVNPPIWWVDPEDAMALKEDSEFMLGEDIIVAPVLEQGATTRDVYLPKGNWKDMNTEEIHVGPKLIQNYKAPLEVLPWFERSTSPPSGGSTSPPSGGSTSPPSEGSTSPPGSGAIFLSPSLVLSILALISLLVSQ